MKVWMSKYALTAGLSEHEAQECNDGSMVQIGCGFGTQYLHGEGREWHRTREEAAARAEAMRTKKIASLRQQIARLEAMRFTDLAAAGIEREGA
jgi:hypothetical protein